MIFLPLDLNIRSLSNPLRSQVDTVALQYEALEHFVSPSTSGLFHEPVS